MTSPRVLLRNFIAVPSTTLASTLRLENGLEWQQDAKCRHHQRKEGKPEEKKVVGREGGVKRKHGVGVRSRDTLELGCLGSNLGGGGCRDLPGEVEEGVMGQDDRNLGGITLLLTQETDAGKPGRNTHIRTICLQYMKQCLV